MTIYFKDLSGWLKLAAVAGIINGLFLIGYALILIAVLIVEFLEFLGI